jgi:hypothetical protein
VLPNHLRLGDFFAHADSGLGGPQQTEDLLVPSEPLLDELGVEATIEHAVRDFGLAEDLVDVAVVAVFPYARVDFAGKGGPVFKFTWGLLFLVAVDGAIA